MELEFRELKFQNATIGLKNATIELLEPSMGRSYLQKKKKKI